MKILLIRPPTKNLISTPVPKYIVENQGIYPPLGLMYVASYIRKNTNNEVFILDCELEDLDYDEIKKKIEKINPCIVGIQTLTFSLIDALNVAKIVKRIDKNIILVMGGRHVDLFPLETISFSFIDYLILGEGEFAFTEFIETISNQKNLEKINGIVYKKNKKVILNNKTKLIENLDTLPFPARDLTKYKNYYSIFSLNKSFTTMMTSRGCPYSCIFCDNRWKKIRLRSAKNVVDEIEECVDLGIKEIFIFDDTFSVRKKRVLDICDEIKKRKIDISFAIRTRIDLVDKEMITELKKAGCERIQYGIESGVQRILDKINKGIDIQQIKKVVKLTKESEITTYADFMIGLPGETKTDILKTLNFANELNLDFAQFSITTPLPGTELYGLGIKNNFFNDFWREFAKNPEIKFEVKYWEESIRKEELLKILDYAYKSFYFKPSYVLKTLLNIKSREEIKKHVSIFFKMLKDF